jgi:hypothetical protein
MPFLPGAAVININVGDRPLLVASVKERNRKLNRSGATGNNTPVTKTAFLIRLTLLKNDI